MSSTVRILQPHPDDHAFAVDFLEEPRTRRHLYLIFDDWEWGYSIRKIDISFKFIYYARLGDGLLKLPPPFIRVEAPRGAPWQFAPIGTKIVATHLRKDRGRNSVPPGFQPIIDVRSRAINFGPGQVMPFLPIFFPVGDDQLYSLDTCGFKKLSLKSLWPPRLEPKYERWFDVWSWECLPEPLFDRFDVTSYAMDGRDGKTILVSTNTTTFAFDMVACLWKQYGDWSLPFTGRAHFVPSLDAFVGISKDPDNLGQLCTCLVVDGLPFCKLSKEKLFREDPAEDHVGATLIYMGEEESEFCLVQCISIEDGKAGQEQLEENGGHMAGGSVDTGDSTADFEPRKKREKAPQWGEVMPKGTSYFYYLTTFSLEVGSLQTRSLKQYSFMVPEGNTQTSFLQDPVVFWM